MQIELGNPAPVDKVDDGSGSRVSAPASFDGPAVTYVTIPYGPDEHQAEHHGYLFGADSEHPVMDPDALRLHVAAAIVDRDGVTNAPGMEAVLAVVSPAGLWQQHSWPGTTPTWVWSDNEEVESYLAAYYGCPAGRPADVEDTHTTYAGGPGIVPGANLDLKAAITKSGRDIQARAFGNPTIPAPLKTTSAPTSTTVTLTGVSAPGSTTAYNGLRAVVSKTSAAVWGIVKSNTTASPPVLTVDRWYNPATPGGAAGSTPANTSVVALVGGAGPAWFMGLSTSTTTPGSPSTTVTLPSEITTATGGLIRQICPWAHTAGTTTTTLTPVFTANTHDSLPAVIGSIGVFQSMVHSDTTGTMFFIDKLSTTATISASGDQLTITETITGT